MDSKIQDRHGNVNLEALQQLLAQEGEGQIAGADIKSEAKDVLSLLRGAGGLNVLQMPRNQTPGSVPAATGLNELDAPDSEAAKMRQLEDGLTFGGLLEKLIDLLLNDSQNAGLKTSEARIKSLLGKMKLDHQAVLKNLQKSLEKSEELTKLQNKMKALGWLMAIFGALMAVLGALTAGGALGIAVAVIGVLGAGVGIVQQARQEGIQKDAEKYADKKIKEYEQSNVGPKGRKTRSELMREYTDKVSKIYMGVSLTFGILGMVMGGVAIGMAIKSAKDIAAKAAEMAAEALKKQGVNVASDVGKRAVQELSKELAKELTKEAAKQNATLLQKMLKAKAPDAAFMQKMSLATSGTGIVGNGAMSGTNAGFGFENAKRQKELADWNANLAMSKKGLDQIQGMIEEEKDALVKALLLLSENASKLSESLGVDADTSNEIARRIGDVGRAI